MGWQDDPVAGEQKPAAPAATWQNDPVVGQPANQQPVIDHLRNSPGMSEASTPLEAFYSGLQTSDTGLAVHGKPNMSLPGNASFAMKLAAGFGQGLGDLPVSASTALVTKSPAATFAAPEAVRQLLMDYYDRGEIHNASDLTHMLATNAWEVGKAAAVGKVAGIAGTVGGKIAGDFTANGFAQTAGNVGGFVLGATDAQAALEGRLPDAQDFALGASMAVGFHVAGAGAGRLSEAGVHVAGNLKTIYRNTGLPPGEVANMARTDPVIHDEVVASDVNGKPVTPKLKSMRPPEPEPYVKSDTVDHVQHASDIAGILKASDQEVSAGMFREYGQDPEIDNLRRAFAEAGRREQDFIDQHHDINEIERKALRGGGNGELPADDTRGRGRFFHGSSSQVDLTDYPNSGTFNSYGPGLYTTDALDAAKGYTKKGTGKEPSLYQVNKTGGEKLVNMDAPLQPDVKQVLTKMADDAPYGSTLLNEALGQDPKNLREVYDEMRSMSRDMGRSASDVQDEFDAIAHTLHQHGYTGLQHEGGGPTGTKPHTVQIHWKPKSGGMTLTDIGKPTAPPVGNKPILADLSKRFNGDSEAVLIATRDGADTAQKYLASGRDPDTIPDSTQEYLKHVQDTHGIAGAWNTVDWEKFPTAKDTSLQQFKDGTYKPKPEAIAGYLQDFGRRAGFRFVAQPPRSYAKDWQMSPEMAGRVGPQYVNADIWSIKMGDKVIEKRTQGRRVEIPADPDELNRRWYGLGRYEILYHEVGHALDHLILNRGVDVTRQLDPAMTAELEVISRQFKPKLWEDVPQHTGTPAELMADGIAVWLHRPDLRAQMPLFKAQYAEELQPYMDMANSALPKRQNGAGAWVPPPGPEAKEPHIGAQPPARGNGGKPPGPPNPPPPGGPPPRDWRSADDAYLQSKFDNRVGEQPIVKKPTRSGLEFELDAAKALDQTMIKRGILNPKTTATTEDMFRSTYGSRSRSDHFFRFGPIDALTWKPTGAPSLKDVADLIDNAGGNKSEFNRYMLSERAIDKAKQGIDTGLFEHGEAEENVRRLKAKYGEARDKLQQFNNGALQYARDSGLISDGQMNAMIAMNPTYMSMRRIMGDDASFEAGPGKGRFFRVNNPLRKMEGSDRDIIDPWLATQDNVRMMIQMADRNRAVGHVVGSREAGAIWGLKQIEDGPKLAEPGSDTFKPYRFGVNETEVVRPLAWRATSKNQFVFYKDGKPTLWEAKDDDLAQLIRGADSPGEMHLLAKIAGMPAALERAGIISDPGFAFGIPLKHQITAYIADSRSPPPYITAIRGLFHMFKMDDIYQEAMAHGVIGGAITDVDKYMQTDAQNILEKTGVFDKSWNVVRHPIQFAQLITETVTNASRVGYYARGKAGGEENTLSLAMGARTAYLDYSERMLDAGMQRWSRYIPFFRAGLLGLQQGWESASERPAQTMMKVTIGMMLPQIALYAANRAQDDLLPAEQQYKNLPSQDRDLYFISPVIGPNGYRVRLAKPFVWGPAIGVPLERIMERAFEQNPHAFDGLLKEMSNDLFPSVIPAIAKPIGEQLANYNMFTGQPLISERLKGASADMQYTEATTEPAKQISRLLGDHQGAGIANVPPIILDNYVREWTGTMGMAVMKALGSVMKPESPDDWTETPFVKSFFLRHPTMNAASVNMFYQDAQQFEQAHQDKVLEVQRGLLADARTDAAKSRVVTLEKFKHGLNMLREGVVRTNGNTTMTVDEKRQLTDQLVNEAIQFSELGSRILKTNSYDPHVAQVLSQNINESLRKALQ